jgi:hypothetical protein
MRVTRRVRPSQVGCAATIGRRRLYAAVASASESRNNAPAVPRISLIIEPDGQIVSNSSAPGIDRRTYESAPELAGSSPRGR